MCIGLVLGGLLAAWDWWAVFWINCGRGVRHLWAYLRLRDTGERHRGRIDWFGNITFALGLGAVLVGCTYGIQPYTAARWAGEPGGAGRLIGGAFLLAVFVIIETRVAEPMFRLRAVQDPGFHLREPGGAAGVDRPRRASSSC